MLHIEHALFSSVTVWFNGSATVIKAVKNTEANKIIGVARLMQI